jgi:hypothetical protein
MDPQVQQLPQDQETPATLPERTMEKEQPETENTPNEDEKLTTESEPKAENREGENLQINDTPNSNDHTDDQDRQPKEKVEKQKENMKRDLESLLSSDEDFTFIDKDKVLAMFTKITKDNIQKM